MRFNKLDLNLLVALDALLKEGSINKAAERVNLSSSAMSNALSRLREYFDDDLLVQIGRKMEPTPRADELREAVRDVLLRVGSTIAAQPTFDPTQSERVFRIFASDYTQMMLGPHLLALAGQQRCTTRFEFLSQVLLPQRDLERGEADLLVIPQRFTSPDHPTEVLYEDSFVCLIWRGSRLAQGEFTFERYAAASHVVMRPLSGTKDSFETWFVERYGVERRVAVVTYSFSAMPALVVGGDLVATVHARLARRMVAAWPLEMRRPPLDIVKMQQAVQWHKYRTKDRGLIWLRNLMHRAARQMDEATWPAGNAALGSVTGTEEIPLPAGSA